MKNDLNKIEFKGIGLNLVLSDYLNLAKKFICYFCKNLVKDPHCCGKCQECFCMECFIQYKKSKKNAKCPYFDIETNKLCNNKLDEGYDITNREKNLLNEIKLRCFNYNDGCEEILGYENFYRHANSCDLRTFPCGNKYCHFQSTKEKVNEHKGICDLEIKICEYCKDEILSIKFSEHQQICEQLEKICFFCKTNFKLKNLYDHNPTCKREYLNFANEENLKKIKSYDEMIIKLKNFEALLKELKSSGKNSNILLGKKKKIIDDEDICKNQSDDIDEKSDDEIDIDAELNYDKSCDKNDIIWVNNKKKYRHKRNGKFTISSLKKLNFDFSIMLRINKLNERDINFSIGFAGKPIVKENYQIGQSKSYLEWALHRYGVITEKNTLNNNFINEIRIQKGDIIELKRRQNAITFAINGKDFDYSFNYYDDNMYLITSLMHLDDEVEIIGFTVYT